MYTHEHTSPISRPITSKLSVDRACCKHTMYTSVCNSTFDNVNADIVQILNFIIILNVSYKRRTCNHIKH